MKRKIIEAISAVLIIKSARLLLFFTPKVFQEQKHKFVKQHQYYLRVITFEAVSPS